MGLKPVERREFAKNAKQRFKINNMSLKEKYQKEAVPAMMEKFGYKNCMAVPRIIKVTVNSSFGKNAAAKTSGERDKMLNFIVQDISLIAGQKATLIKSKKSIAGFKLRAGIEVAAMATLRKNKMWDFLERFIYLSLPKSRDFKGINLTAVDNNGNLSVGFREHINFPEISAEKEKAIFGLQITVSTNAKNREKGLELFKLLGFPIKK